MQVFLLPLLLDPLVLPQQFLVIIVLIVLRLRVHPRLLLLFLLIVLDEGLRVGIFREGVICEIDELLSFLVWSFDFLLEVCLVIADHVHIISVEIRLLYRVLRPFFDDLQPAVLFADVFGFTLQQLGFEVLFPELVERTLAWPTILEVEITRKILSGCARTLAE